MEFTSGNPLADRRADYAAQLLDAGDAMAACDLMEQALELAPAWAAGWFRLGEMREMSGLIDAAIAAWQHVLHLDTDDRLGASLKLALAGAAAGPQAMPAAFVETLFDQYAPKFDDALVGKLDYCVPELLDAAIAATGKSSFQRALDLGCGTGLMGARLRSRVAHLSGNDLSAEMLRQAEVKGIYDILEKANINELPPVVEDKYDLITAADVFMYLGDLSAAFAWVAAALAPAGLFAFSVERLEEGDGFALRPSRRYAHSQSCVEELLTRFGFKVPTVDRAIIRKDRGEPVEGLVFVAVNQAG